MSFKLLLHIGYFDPDTGRLLPLGVDVTAVREAIVGAGGRLPEHCSSEDSQRLWIATAIERRTNRKVLGFLGGEFVILHESDLLMTTIGYGPHGPMLAFLDWMCRECGCQVYSPDEGTVVTEEILSWLIAKEREANPEDQSPRA